MTFPLRLAAPILVLLACLGSAGAQAPQAPIPNGQAGTTEQLMFAPPPGWVQVHQSRQGGIYSDVFVPPGQTLERWSEMLVMQVWPPGKTPDVLLEEFTANVRKGCPQANPGPVQLGSVNGYLAGFRALNCPVNQATQRGEASFFYVVAGKQAVYVAQRAWNLPPNTGIPKDVGDRANTYLRGIFPCDVADNRHPCGKPMR